MTPFNHAMSFTITINVSYTPPLTTKTKAEMHEHALGIYVNHLHHLKFNLVQSRASKGQKANGVADRLAEEGVISQSLSICYDSSYQFYLWPFLSVLGCSYAIVGFGQFSALGIVAVHTICLLFSYS